MSLAIAHQVNAAPFFLVETDTGSLEVYTDDSCFLQEVMVFSP